MTDFDKTLIDKAKQISRYHYRDINVLIGIADSNEAREQLAEIRRQKCDSVQETL